MAWNYYVSCLCQQSNTWSSHLNQLWFIFHYIVILDNSHKTVFQWHPFGNTGTLYVKLFILCISTVLSVRNNVNFEKSKLWKIILTFKIFPYFRASKNTNSVWIPIHIENIHRVPDSLPNKNILLKLLKYTNFSKR